jgi:chaperonin cofactor prefoldin
VICTLTDDEIAGYRAAAARAYDEIDSLDADNKMFRQIVQVLIKKPHNRTAP